MEAIIEQPEGQVSSALPLRASIEKRQDDFWEDGDLRLKEKRPEEKPSLVKSVATWSPMNMHIPRSGELSMASVSSFAAETKLPSLVSNDAMSFLGDVDTVFSPVQDKRTKHQLTHWKVPRGTDYLTKYCSACHFNECEKCIFCHHSKLTKVRRMNLDRFLRYVLMLDPKISAKSFAAIISKYARLDDFALEFNNYAECKFNQHVFCDHHQSEVDTRRAHVDALEKEVRELRKQIDSRDRAAHEANEARARLEFKHAATKDESTRNRVSGLLRAAAFKGKKKELELILHKANTVAEEVAKEAEKNFRKETYNKAHTDAQMQTDTEELQAKVESHQAELQQKLAQAEATIDRMVEDYKQLQGRNSFLRRKSSNVRRDSILVQRKATEQLFTDIQQLQLIPEQSDKKTHKKRSKSKSESKSKQLQKSRSKSTSSFRQSKDSVTSNDSAVDERSTDIEEEEEDEKLSWTRSEIQADKKRAPTNNTTEEDDDKSSTSLSTSVSSSSASTSISKEEDDTKSELLEQFTENLLGTEGCDEEDFNVVDKSTQTDSSGFDRRCRNTHRDTFSDEYYDEDEDSATGLRHETLESWKPPPAEIAMTMGPLARYVTNLAKAMKESDNLTVDTTLNIVGNVLERKVLSDISMGNKGKTSSSLASHVYDFMGDKFGIKAMAKKKTTDLIAAIRKHCATSQRIANFAKMVGMHPDTEALYSRDIGDVVCDMFKCLVLEAKAISETYSGRGPGQFLVSCTKLIASIVGDDGVSLSSPASYDCPVLANWLPPKEIKQVIAQILTLKGVIASGIILPKKGNRIDGGPHLGVFSDPIDFDAAHALLVDHLANATRKQLYHLQKAFGLFRRSSKKVRGLDYEGFERLLKWALGPLNPAKKDRQRLFADILNACGNSDARVIDDATKFALAVLRKGGPLSRPADTRSFWQLPMAIDEENDDDEDTADLILDALAPSASGRDLVIDTVDDASSMGDDDAENIADDNDDVDDNGEDTGTTTSAPCVDEEVTSSVAEESEAAAGEVEEEM